MVEIKDKKEGKVLNIKMGHSFNSGPQLRDSNYSLRLINPRLAHLRGFRGYTPIRDKDELVHSEGCQKNNDGQVTYRDMILAKIPRKLLEQRKADLEHLNNMSVSGQSQQLKDLGTRAGIQVEDDTVIG